MCEVGLWIVIVAGVVIVAAVVVAITKRRPADVPTPSSPPVTPPAPTSAAPMSDLESALSQVTDRQGRPMKERFDAESEQLDRLRDPDDTGPLLRRALDSVANHEPGLEPGADDATS